jgi:DNA-binding response OmpR family regulator
MAEIVRALIVDDEARVRLTLKKTLERTGHAVAVAASGEEALDVLRETAFDVAVVDLNLGGDVDGLRVVEAIGWRWPEMAVVILTAHGSLSSAIKAIREGVDDYLLKPAGPSKVRQAVERALQRKRASRDRGQAESPPIVQCGGFSVDLDQHLATVYGRTLDLTPQELKLLVHLIQNRHRVVPPPELVRVVRDYEPDSLHEARQIIKWYIYRLRQQVESDPADPCHIVNVRGVGYRFKS